MANVDGDRVPTSGGDDNNSGSSSAKQDSHDFVKLEDDALIKLIMGSHAPDSKELDVKPVLAIVEDILSLAKPTSSDDKHDSGKSSTHDSTDNPEISKALTNEINNISLEMVHKCGFGDTHSVTTDLLRFLSMYSWEAKVVITLAAFSITYGEFRLAENFQTTNPYARTIVDLKDLPVDTTTQSGDELKKYFNMILDLLNSALRATHYIIEFKDLPPIVQDSPEVRDAKVNIPKAVYWIIRSLLACAAKLTNLTGIRHRLVLIRSRRYIAKYSTLQAWEMSTHEMFVMIEDFKNKLNSQLKFCKDFIEFKQLMEADHKDNIEVLRPMFKGQIMSLYNGTTRTNESPEVLRKKYVLLLISNLELFPLEFGALHFIYNQGDAKKRQQYEVLWLPILDPTTSMSPSSQENLFFDDLRNKMPWLSVDQPWTVEPVAIRYIREEWKFIHKPMLVVLDLHGKPSNLNALPMVLIWLSAGLPFTKERERELWAINTQCSISLLAEGIYPEIVEWLRDDKVICLYGGDHIDWIRQFTRSAREAARGLGVPLEMLYVGKHNPKESDRRCNEIIHGEKLSHVFSVEDYNTFVCFFWARLWSMWDSKKQMGRTVEDDQLMNGIMSLLMFDSTEKGWACFGRGNHEITKGNADLVLRVLDRYLNWGSLVDHPDKFVPVLDEQLRGVHLEHQHTRLIMSGHSRYIPERVECAECGELTEKFVVFRCRNLNDDAGRGNSTI